VPLRGSDQSHGVSQLRRPRPQRARPSGDGPASLPSADPFV
jgi:hypothetical protein